MRGLFVVLFGTFLLIPAAAAAVELTVATGGRWGEVGFPTESTTALVLCVTTPCVVAEASTEDGAAPLSLVLDLPVSGRWMVEGLLTRWDGDMEFRSDLPGELADRGTFESTSVLVGLLRHWGGGRVRPFATAALGVTAFESSVPAYDRPFFPGIVTRPVDEEVAAGSLAGGVKAELGPHLALRVEGRAYWHDFSEQLGGTKSQQEVTVGLTYLW